MRSIHILILTLFIFGCSDIKDQTRILEIDTKYKNGQLDEAKSDLELLLTESPENETAWTLLGHILSDQDLDDEAKEAYLKALDIDSKTVEAITGMGILSRRAGNYDKAAEYYYKAIELDPEYAQAYSSLVVIHLKQKDFESAVDVGKKGYALDKEDPIIASNLAVAYHYYGDSINGQKYYNIAAKIGYQNLESLDKIFSGEFTIFD